MSDTKPIFIFSLPRSGSTLLQRIIAQSGEVETTSEPWVLLPLFSILKEKHLFSDYGHSVAARAISDFREKLPNGKADIDRSIRLAANNIYNSVAGGKRYFLDKTPRYHLICDDITRIFPDAKFIFLWRNPISVVSSIIETWGEGKWNIYQWKVDLYKGLSNLIDCQEKVRNRSYVVNFEDLLDKPQQVLPGLFEYLELDYSEEYAKRFSETTLEGGMGDPNRDKFDEIQTSVTEKWKTTIHNSLRRNWLISYLQWIGAGRLSEMGYELNQLKAKLLEVKFSFRHLPSDVFRMSLSKIHPYIEPGIVRDKWSGRKDFEKTIKHY